MKHEPRQRFIPREPTPITDAAEIQFHDGEQKYVKAIVARKLETDLIKTKSELERERQIKERIYKDGIRFHRELMELKKRMAAQPNIRS